jgi:hypothetical protein
MIFKKIEIDMRERSNQKLNLFHINHENIIIFF